MLACRWMRRFHGIVRVEGAKGAVDPKGALDTLDDAAIVASAASSETEGTVVCTVVGTGVVGISDDICARQQRKQRGGFTERPASAQRGRSPVVHVTHLVSGSNKKSCDTADTHGTQTRCGSRTPCEHRSTEVLLLPSEPSEPSTPSEPLGPPEPELLWWTCALTLVWTLVLVLPRTLSSVHQSCRMRRDDLGLESVRYVVGVGGRSAVGTGP
jgi:hypothetical protein